MSTASWQKIDFDATSIDRLISVPAGRSTAEGVGYFSPTWTYVSPGHISRTFLHGLLSFRFCDTALSVCVWSRAKANILAALENWREIIMSGWENFQRETSKENVQDGEMFVSCDCRRLVVAYQVSDIRRRIIEYVTPTERLQCYVPRLNYRHHEIIMAFLSNLPTSTVYHFNNNIIESSNLRRIYAISERWRCFGCI